MIDERMSHGYGGATDCMKVTRRPGASGLHGGFASATAKSRNQCLRTAPRIEGSTLFHRCSHYGDLEAVQMLVAFSQMYRRLGGCAKFGSGRHLKLSGHLAVSRKAGSGTRRTRTGVCYLWRVLPAVVTLQEHLRLGTAHSLVLIIEVGRRACMRRSDASRLGACQVE